MCISEQNHEKIACAMRGGNMWSIVLENVSQVNLSNP